MRTGGIAVVGLALVVAATTGCLKPVDDCRGNADGGSPACAVCTPPCGETERCDRGTCVPECPGCPPGPEAGFATCDPTCDFACHFGFHRCGDACVPADSVTACGERCLTCLHGANEVPACVGGRCEVACSPKTHRCGDRCLSDFSVDSCGSSCEPCALPAGDQRTCDGTTCGFTCFPGTHRCWTQCVSDSSEYACGPSCVLCPSPPYSSAECVADACTWHCLPGFHRCGSSCERDESLTACGSGCVACTEPIPANSDRLCRQGACAWACRAGFHACGNSCLSDTSVAACGPSCTTCPPSADPTAEVACVGGACVVRCEPGLVWSRGACRRVTAVAAGLYHSCALAEGGGITCWGENGDGQLGDGTTASSTEPVEVVGLDAGWVEVSIGARHTCAVLTTREVACWGWNWYLQTGSLDGGLNVLTPTVVPGLGPIRSISSGELHTCALKASGEVSCWGHGSMGQLGMGTTGTRVPPVAVVGLGADVAQVTAGGEHTCARSPDGGASCWGANGNGQLGDGSGTSSTVPVAVANALPGFVALSAGSYRTCGVTRVGSVGCWGSTPLSALNPTTPQDVPGVPFTLAIDARGSHVCALAGDGGGWCWGGNISGELGDGTTFNRPAPTRVQLASPIAQLRNGTTHTCAVTADGRAWCWGSNVHGQVGDGTFSNRSLPALVRDRP